MTVQIVVLDGCTLNPGDNPWSPVEELGHVTVFDHTARTEIIERLMPAAVAVTNKVPLPDDVLQQAPELMLVAVTVVLHCNLTPNSKGMINRDFLSRMKPSAFLINPARGGFVDEAALADALNRDQLAGAAVDVVSSEPIKQENPLLAAKNCFITPHMAWATLAARRRLMQTTASNIQSFLAGTPINVVN